MDTTLFIACVALAVFGLVVWAAVVQPGETMVFVGVLLIGGGVFAQLSSKTVFQEISASLGVVGGLIAIGLGLVIIQLVAIRRTLERRPSPPLL